MTLADLPQIIEQYVDEVAFLVRQRARSVSAPDVTLSDLVGLDNRVWAHLEGLRVSGESGRVACDLEMAEGDWGVLFAALVLALEARDRPRIDQLISLAEETPSLRAGVTAALAWVSGGVLQGTVKDLLTAASRFRRSVAIECCAAHGADAGQALRAAVIDSEPILRTRALCAAGQLGRSDLRTVCEQSVDDSDPDCRFAAAWSAVLLGSRGAAVEALIDTSVTAGPNRAKASMLVLAAMNVSTSHQVLQRLGRDPEQRRWLIQGSGINGDPAYVPWLITQMENVETSRLAAESFSLITGVTLGSSGLQSPQPEGFESGPNDDPEESDVDMDPDDGLPWPETRNIDGWWATNCGRFAKGRRYFMGRLVTREACIHVVKNGYQRQRAIAAQHLVLLEPGTLLFNIGTPARRQRRLLTQLA